MQLDSRSQCGEGPREGRCRRLDSTSLKAQGTALMFRARTRAPRNQHHLLANTGPHKHGPLMRPRDRLDGQQQASAARIYPPTTPRRCAPTQRHLEQPQAVWGAPVFRGMRQKGPRVSHHNLTVQITKEQRRTRTQDRTARWLVRVSKTAHTAAGWGFTCGCLHTRLHMCSTHQGERTAHACLCSSHRVPCSTHMVQTSVLPAGTRVCAVVLGCVPPKKANKRVGEAP